MSVLGWVIFIVALLVSIMLHESGHFVMAKKFGMKATQYFVGFGPTLWSRMKGETEYGVKALPLGGFVKIIGMTTLEEVDPADEPRSFRRQPGWQRAIVLAAGSFMHFVLAFVLLLVLAMGIGLANDNTATIGAIDNCVPASQTAQCAPGNPRSPASQVGLRAGDKVIAFDGQPVHTWSTLGAAIRRHPVGTAVTITVQRGGKELSLRATTAAIRGRSGSYLGISSATAFQRVGPVRAVQYAGSSFGQVITGSVTALGQLPAAVPKLFAKDRSSTAGGNVSSIVGAANDTGQALAANIGVASKISIVLLIIISLNIFVGAFNLLPLLPLDGGHLAVVIYERVRAWLARLRGRPDPGLVDMTRLMPLSFGVFAVLVFIGLMLIMADILNPVHIIQ